MSSSPTIPGLYYNFLRPPAEPSPIRTDVAGFYGRTMRGPVGTPVRVQGWREYVSVFGGLVSGAMTPYAVRGYFDNEAQIAYVVRLIGAKSQTAAGTWVAGTLNPSTEKLNPDWPGASGLKSLQFQFQANSPGDWANDTWVQVRYWAYGQSGSPEFEVEINPPNEAAEILSGISPTKFDSTENCTLDNFAPAVNSTSEYVTVTACPSPGGFAKAEQDAPPGPRYYEWPAFRLSGGTTIHPGKEDYLAAIQNLGHQPEVALIVSPDLYHPHFYKPGDPQSAEKIFEILYAELAQANRLHDRLVVIDVPPDQADPIQAAEWVDTQLRNPVPPAPTMTEEILRNGAVYHPWLLVPDPLGTAASPQTCVPCSGYVTGVISRLDLQQGAYITPANAAIFEAVDLSRTLSLSEQALVYSGGINLLTCSPGQGLLIWGGRVLGPEQQGTGDVLGGFVAHRRLIHLLVRAIRRVAEPLVFEVNGPQLWLAFVRAITTVLLQAYRAGALQGDTPDQAFRVQCDASTNPPEQIETGTVVCVIQVAPAVPMEFITLRVSVSAQGQLEIFES